MLGSGLAFALLGAGVLATLPLPIGVRLPFAAAWLLCSIASSARLMKRYRGISGYRIYADGSAEIVRADGRRAIGRLVPGTFLLPRLAWLRVRVAGDGAVGELIAGDSRTSQQWRRFQVICRHLSAC